MRGLLEAERAEGIHKPGAVLHDPSAAIALLWMRRTLQFLLRCMEGVAATGEDAPSMPDVGASAYRLELEPFHGWLLKNTFAVAMQAMPRKEEVIGKLGAHLPEVGRETAVRREVTECMEMIRGVVDSMRGLYVELDLEDMRKV